MLSALPQAHVAPASHLPDPAGWLAGLPLTCISSVHARAHLVHAWRLPCPAGLLSRVAVTRKLSLHGWRINPSCLSLQSERQAWGGPGSWRLDRPAAGRPAGRPTMGGPFQATQGAPAVLPGPDCNAAASPRHDGAGLHTGQAVRRCRALLRWAVKLPLGHGSGITHMEGAQC